MEENRYISRLKERLKQDPDSRLFLSLAEELRKRQMVDEAIALLGEGIKRHPDYSAARIALGRLCLSRDMLQEARAEYLEVLRKNPESSAAHRGLARVWVKLGDKREALQEYRRLSEIDPLDDEARSYVTSYKQDLIDRLSKLSGAIRARFSERSLQEVREQ